MSDARSQSHAGRRRWAVVKQNTADSFLILLMTSFGVTVISVRVFLELTGYPQIGDSTYHVAHMLWGGLLIFLALLLQLIWSNRWVLWAAALMGGVGMGLFIDEVGKFITQSNDYFFPLAFPIIYAFMLTCVWLYLRVRRSQTRDTRTLMYHVLDELKQVLDNDLDPFEHAELTATIDQIIATATDGNQKRLALELRDFVKAQDVNLARDAKWLERLSDRARIWLATHPSRGVLKALLVLGFGLMVVQAAIKLVGMISIAVIATSGGREFGVFLSNYVIVSGKSIYVVQHPSLLLTQNVLIFVTGMLALVALILLLIRRERLGLRVGTLGLVITLTVVNLITFYFNQIYTIVDAVGQLILLSIANLYRWRFYLSQPGSAASAGQSATKTAV